MGRVTITGVNLTAYRSVLATPGVPVLLLVGLGVRIPVAAAALVLTLHVVGVLGGSYTLAGIAGLVLTATMAASAPWRGRAIDRVGLRRALVPSVLVMTACWVVAPFVGYVPLLILTAVSGLIYAPVMAVVRQAVMAAVPAERRRSALSLDALTLEFSYMIGPLFGVWAATQWPGPWVLFSAQLLVVVGACALWLLNPPMHRQRQGPDQAGTSARADDRADHSPGPRRWQGLAFVNHAAVLMCVVAAVAALTLSGTEIALVAVMRQLDASHLLGMVLAVWALGSAAGGLVYGAMPRPASAPVLLLGLGTVTLPLAWAQQVPTVALLAFLAGVFCAPTLVATVDGLGTVVPEHARGQALGWHSSLMTAGAGAGAPLAGVAVDAAGPGAAFLVVAVVGVLVGAVTWRPRRAGARSRQLSTSRSGR